jgi:putative flippase GtrA
MTSTSAPETTGQSFFAGVIDSIRDKGLKYMGVSVGNVLFGGGLLIAFLGHMPPLLANALAIGISSVPAYYMSRLWVWGKTGKSHFKKEVLPFWIFVIAGFVLSTIAIAIAKDHTTREFVILFVQVASFGVLWILRFFFLDKLFHVEIAEDDTPDEE